MKKSLTLALLTISFFSLIFSSCGKSGAISGPVVTPTPTPTPTTSGTKNYYVSDGTGSDGNTGLSINVPFKTITAGVNAAVAGDTVFIMNGTYTSSFTLTKSGTTDKYITYKNYATHKPKIVISGAIWSSVKISANYIVFEGIEMQGNNANLTYAGALDAYNQYLATGVNNSVHAQYNTNAIDISTNNPHHIVIRNCVVHDFPGGGISGIGSDYLTLEGNIIYNNCWYMMYAGSGISILTPSNSDAADVNKYKNIIRNNIVYGNKCLIPWVSTKALSDGNGIIIDVNQLTSNSAAYTGRTLVENNVSFNNGGGGVHSYRADHVDIINNTAYGNGTNMGYPDIDGQSNTDVKIINNIMYSRLASAGGKCNLKPATGATVSYSNNIYFNGTVGFMGTNDKVVDPMFMNITIDGTANFSLKTGSPAIDAGTITLYSLKDILGIARPKGAGVDCGAYEVQ